jgi:hypothetical protein
MELTTTKSGIQITKLPMETKQLAKPTHTQLQKGESQGKLCFHVIFVGLKL